MLTSKKENRAITIICYYQQMQSPEVFCKGGALKNFAKFTGKQLRSTTLLKKRDKKETLAQMFSCKFCEISKSTFSYRTPPAVASVWNSTLLFLFNYVWLRYHVFIFMI